MDPMEALSTACDADNATPEIVPKEAESVPQDASSETSNICDDRQTLEQILSEDSTISQTNLGESSLAEPAYHQNLESDTKSKQDSDDVLPQTDLAALQDMLDDKEAEETSSKLSLTENLSDVITGPDESPSKLSDLKIGKTEHTFATHLETKPSESPPLLLLQGSTAAIDDGVFSTRELHQVPDQLLAEPCALDREDLDDRTENLIASNIEEQLREFEGSDDDSLLAKDCVEPEARLSLASSLPIIQSSSSAKSEDDTLKILSSDHQPIEEDEMPKAHDDTATTECLATQAEEEEMLKTHDDNITIDCLATEAEEEMLKTHDDAITIDCFPSQAEEEQMPETHDDTITLDCVASQAEEEEMPKTHEDTITIDCVVSQAEEEEMLKTHDDTITLDCVASQAKEEEMPKTHDDAIRIDCVAPLAEEEEMPTDHDDAITMDCLATQAEEIEQELSQLSDEVKEEDKTKESDQLDVSENENIPFTEVDVDMSGKEKSFDTDEKDAFADIHNEIDNVEKDAFADVSNEIENVEIDEHASDEKTAEDENVPATSQIEVENITEEANEETSKTDEVMDIDQESIEEQQESEDGENENDTPKDQPLPETIETPSENVEANISTLKSSEYTSIENELSEMDCDMPESSPKVIEIIDVHIDEDTLEEPENIDSHNNEENDEQMSAEQSESVTVPVEQQDTEILNIEQAEIGSEDRAEWEGGAQDNEETDSAAQEIEEKENDALEEEKEDDALEEETEDGALEEEREDDALEEEREDDALEEEREDDILESGEREDEAVESEEREDVAVEFDEGEDAAVESEEREDAAVENEEREAGALVCEERIDSSQESQESDGGAQVSKEKEVLTQQIEEKEEEVADSKEKGSATPENQESGGSVPKCGPKEDEAESSTSKDDKEISEEEKENVGTEKTQSAENKNRETSGVPNVTADNADGDVVELDTSNEQEASSKSPESQSNEKAIESENEKQQEAECELEKDQDQVEVHIVCDDDEESEPQQKDQNAEDGTRTEGVDEEVCLLPDSEQEISEADKERATLAKEAARKTTEVEDMVYKEEYVETESQNYDDCTILEDEQSEPVTVDQSAQDNSENTAMVELEIKELPIEAKQEKCFKCRKIKPCRYKMLDDDELKYLCSIKCVQSFRNTSKEKYNLTAKKIIITATIEMKKFCVRCRLQKNCKYQFNDPEFNTSSSYLCDARCLDLFIGLNVEKYIVRSKKYTVEEMCRDEQKKCLHCGETKGCRYYFLHDTERFFICNETCFNLLAKEQPDRFRLKRRSVRVRDLRATPTTGTGTEKDKIVARTEQEAETARRERENSFIRRCSQCFQPVALGERMLSWETMDFCNEFCLEAYQHIIGSTCTMCKNRVSIQSLGKYCVRFGFEVRQFCRSACLDSFKKGLKVCSFCQKDISKDKNGFLAPVGDKNQFKDFCTQACMISYEEICSYKKKLPVSLCAVCNVEKQARVEICLENRSYNFCSNPCFSAFKFVNNIIPDQCLMCLKYFERSNSSNFTIYQEQNAKVFCSNICLNIFIILNRKIVPCEWCKVKKYNFDMIQQKSGSVVLLMCSISCLTYYRTSIKAITLKKQICAQCQTEATAQYHLTMSDATIRNFCTYQCVMAFQSQFGNKPLTLDPPDTSKALVAADSTNQPVPTGLPKRIKSKASNPGITVTKTTATKVASISASAKKTAKATLPVIMNVSSLAPPAQASNTASVNTTATRTLRGGRGKIQKPIMTSIPASELEKSVPQTLTPIKVPSSICLKKIPNTTTVQTQTTVDIGKETRSRSTTFANSYTQTLKIPKKNVSIAVGEGRIDIPIVSQEAAVVAKEPKIETKVEYKTNVITVPKKPVQLMNKQTMCKPIGVSKGVNCRPHNVSVECQTDEKMERKVLIPIPVPIYVPQPMHMYSLPFPCPVPIPLPIPIPIFIPTTRNSAEGIMKEIRKIQEKMPSDPYEAELLMMAAMVADDKKKSESDSDSEVDHHQQQIVETEYTTETIERSNSFGEDMLQMALKMATEYDEPAVDLESAMTTNTISQPHSNEELVEEHDIHPSHMLIVDSNRQVTSPTRGRKRTLSPSLPRPNRLNTMSAYKKMRRMETQPILEPEPEVREPMEKPDANMCLKYTFGVNAWKQWVMTKNADLEKSSIRRKPFKSELLQLTADELNYSLSLFVKEVRKPNGSEYAPDTIYYLVLGIQQYLYENNRIDNIFTDPYYERFTDCLDEVAKKFSVLYNDSQYIVTRVEEEHLWECKQLGAHSPHVLLSTLMFFNTKHFNLTTVEEHMQLSFSHIMKHWKRSPPGTKLPGSRNVLLRFYPPQTGEPNPRKKKVYEQQENDENPLRCPVKLYEFYLSKCPESVKTRNDVFYLQPERSCVPDSPVWYSTQPLSREALNKMLHRVKMVKEINVALLSS